MTEVSRDLPQMLMVQRKVISFLVRRCTSAPFVARLDAFFSETQLEKEKKRCESNYTETLIYRRPTHEPTLNAEVEWQLFYPCDANAFAFGHDVKS